jgi:hypothetical protein
MHATGPPPGHTGGFGEPTCVACHTEYGLNEPGGMLRVEGLPPAYEPGGQYALTVRLETEDMGAGGFQMAMRFLDGPEPGLSAGSWEPLDANVTVTPDSIDGTPYVHHTQVGSRVSDPHVATWTMLWHAPEAGGAVMLNAAANSGNGDDSPYGDLIYTFSAEASPAGASLLGQGLPGIHPSGPSRR